MLRSSVVIAVIFLLLPACKPEKPALQAFRVSLDEAVKSRNVIGLAPEAEDLTAARLGADLITLKELVRAVQELPAVSRLYYSDRPKAEIFLKDYVLMNLMAREAVKAGLDSSVESRRGFLGAMEKQARDDFLANRVRVSGDDSTSGEFERRREETWRSHLTVLRKNAAISIDESALAGFATAPSSSSTSEKQER